MDPALGTLNLPEIDDERRRRAEAATAALAQQFAAAQAANQAEASRFDPTGGAALAAYQPQIAQAAAMGAQRLQDVNDRYAAAADGRTALANIWMNGIDVAGQQKMDKMAQAAEYQWLLAHPAGTGGGGGGGGGGGRGGGGGGRRRSGRSSKSSSGGGLSVAPAAQPRLVGGGGYSPVGTPSYVQVANSLLAQRRPAPSFGGGSGFTYGTTSRPGT